MSDEDIVRDWLEREHPEATITAKGRGYLEALQGKGIGDNPYAADSRDWLDWLAGFSDAILSYDADGKYVGEKR